MAKPPRDVANGHTHQSLDLRTGALSAPSSPTPAAGGKLGTAGTKALLLRARKELAPLEDPNQSIAD